MFDNKDSLGDGGGGMTTDDSEENESGAAFLIRILQYLETPQYLRKALFPKHNNLRFVVRTKSCSNYGVYVSFCKLLDLVFLLVFVDRIY